MADPVNPNRLVCIAPQSFDDGRSISQEPVAQIPVPATTYQEEGSWLGWFACKFRGLSFSNGAEYNWYKDNCDIKGTVMLDSGFFK